MTLINENIPMSDHNCSTRIEILTLVVLTANCINEFAVPSLNITYYLVSPICSFTAYVFLTIFLICGAKGKFPSHFLKIYGLLACIILHCSLSTTVFRELADMNIPEQYSLKFVLLGLLPIFIAALLLGDLVISLFAIKTQQLGPVLPMPEEPPITII